MSTAYCSAPSELNKNKTTSKVKLDHINHLWTLENFDFCEAKSGAVESPEFSAYTNDKVIWMLKLRPGGKANSNSEDSISLYLMLRRKSEHKTVFAKFSFSILDKDLNKEVIWNNNGVHEFEAGKSWGRSELCKKDENFRMKCLPNKVLKIFCAIKFSTEKNFVVEHHRYRSRNQASLMSTFADRDVTENLKILFKTHLLADVVISVEGEDFPAHKAILAARSKVFAAMFQHDTKENEENRVEIKDISKEIISEMLRFIYTGRCENLDKLGGELLVAADKYDLDLLKTICTEALCENLSIENASKSLILADMHSANELKTEAINFIVARSAKVLKTTGWKSMLSYPVLIEEVCQAMSQQLEQGDSDND